MKRATITLGALAVLVALWAGPPQAWLQPAPAAAQQQNAPPQPTPERMQQRVPAQSWPQAWQPPGGQQPWGGQMPAQTANDAGYSSVGFATVGKKPSQPAMNLTPGAQPQGTPQTNWAPAPITSPFTNQAFNPAGSASPNGASSGGLRAPGSAATNWGPTPGWGVQSPAQPEIPRPTNPSFTNSNPQDRFPQAMPAPPTQAAPAAERDRQSPTPPAATDQPPGPSPVPQMASRPEREAPQFDRPPAAAFELPRQPTAESPTAPPRRSWNYPSTTTAPPPEAETSPARPPQTGGSPEVRQQAQERMPSNEPQPPSPTAAQPTLEPVEESFHAPPTMAPAAARPQPAQPAGPGAAEAGPRYPSSTQPPPAEPGRAPDRRGIIENQPYMPGSIGRYRLDEPPGDLPPTGPTARPENPVAEIRDIPAPPTAPADTGQTTLSVRQPAAQPPAPPEFGEFRSSYPSTNSPPGAMPEEPVQPEEPAAASEDRQPPPQVAVPPNLGNRYPSTSEPPPPEGASPSMGGSPPGEQGPPPAGPVGSATAPRGVNEPGDRETTADDRTLASRPPIADREPPIAEPPPMMGPPPPVEQPSPRTQAPPVEPPSAAAESPATDDAISRYMRERYGPSPAEPVEAEPAPQQPPPALPPPAPERPFPQPSQEQTDLNTGPAELVHAQVLARVDSEVILAADVLPMIDSRLKEVADQIPSSQLAQIREQNIKQALLQHIRRKLMYLDAKREIPAEAYPQVIEQLDAAFQERIEQLVIENNLKDRAELEEKMLAQGTTIEQQRRAFQETMLANQWMSEKTKINEQVTREELLNYYNEHREEYYNEARARWQELMASTTKTPNKAEAYNRLVAMGNRVLGGEAFEVVAREASDGVSAGEGGQRDWTVKGSLAFKDLDQALFTLPPGQMSPIIETPLGFHIIKVVERQEASYTSFPDTQKEIREKILEDRRAEARKEYIARLRESARIWTVFDGPYAGDATTSSAPAAGNSTAGDVPPAPPLGP